MADLLFLIAILCSVGIGLHMAIQPQWHADQARAKGGTGTFADPRKVRQFGIFFAVAGLIVFLLRSFT